MNTLAVKEKRSLPMSRNRSRPSRFGCRSPEVKAQQTEIHHILRSTGAQAKFIHGQPNDKYEQEAGRVADQVMRMSAADVAQRVKAGTNQPMKIQRMCPECEEEMAQRKPEEEEEQLQAKEMPGQIPEVTPGLESRINNLKSGGQPLDPATRAFFGPRFRQDFNQVRVHTGANAEESARNVNAKAFTLGRDVVFGAGEYSSDSSSGRKLLAHELTHVIQQANNQNSTGSGSINLTIQKKSKTEKEKDKLEKETQLDMLQTGELDTGIVLLVNQVGQLDPFVLNQIDIDFSGSKLEILKKRFNEEALKGNKVKPWAGGGRGKRSLGLERGRGYSFAEGQMWSRLDFVATLAGSLGSVTRVLKHFGEVEKAEVPGIVWLHRSAARQLEAVYKTFGKNKFPLSYVAMQLRGRHQERHERGMLMHPVGYAIDFYPVDNPMLTDDDLHTLLGVVGEGPTHMKLTDERGRELRHKLRDVIIVKLGQETAAGVPESERDPAGLQLLAKVDQAYGNMVATSERFKQVLADTPEKRQQVIEKLKSLREKYHSDVMPLEVTFNKAKVEEAVAKRAFERAQAKLDKAYDSLQNAERSYWDVRLNPKSKGKDITRALNTRHKAFDAYSKAESEKYAAKRKYKTNLEEGKWWDRVAAEKELTKAVAPLTKELEILLAPILAKLDNEIADARSRKDKVGLKSLEVIKSRLTEDFQFVFGASAAADVKNPPVLQLLERGFALEGSPPVGETKLRDRNRVFNTSFIKVMMKHGFEPGAAWRGSTDTMHFNFAEGKAGVVGSSPTKGLEILFRYLVQHSGSEAGPETMSPEGTKPT